MNNETNKCLIGRGAIKAVSQLQWSQTVSFDDPIKVNGKSARVPRLRRVNFKELQLPNKTKIQKS